MTLHDWINILLISKSIMLVDIDTCYLLYQNYSVFFVISLLQCCNVSYQKKAFLIESSPNCLETAVCTDQNLGLEVEKGNSDTCSSRLIGFGVFWRTDWLFFSWSLCVFLCLFLSPTFPSLIQDTFLTLTLGVLDASGVVKHSNTWW